MSLSKLLRVQSAAPPECDAAIVDGSYSGGRRVLLECCFVSQADTTMQADRRSLSDRLAMFPRLGLANLPTPLEPMKRLTAHLGGPRLWVKREDATGLGFGGNKLRKLDYVLHQAVSSGADTIVSGGVVQSNCGCSQARARMSSCGLPWPAGTADARIQDLGQRVSQSAVRRAPP
jgi:hypothetical protein